MIIEIISEKFDPAQKLGSHRGRLKAGSLGACASFIGYARDFNQQVNIKKLTLEHYPGMTEKQLARIAENAEKQWDLIDTLIVHRVGEIDIGEAIVLTAAWAAHREDAFGACRFLIEALKTDAPFWKKEQLAGGSNRWVDR